MREITPFGKVRIAQDQSLEEALLNVGVRVARCVHFEN